MEFIGLIDPAEGQFMSPHRLMKPGGRRPGPSRTPVQRGSTTGGSPPGRGRRDRQSRTRSPDFSILRAGAAEVQRTGPAAVQRPDRLPVVVRSQMRVPHEDRHAAVPHQILDPEDRPDAPLLPPGD